MFKRIEHIGDVQPAVSAKKEIRFLQLPHGVTLGCYLFAGADTFDSPEALECRGIAFDATGRIVSRPLHKFFNVGEKDWLLPQKVAARDDVVAVFDKLDGSMIATAWVGDRLLWRSKKAFDSDVVKLTESFLEMPEHRQIASFAAEVASSGMTAIFELTHPEARIVVAQERPALHLLHVRDNVSGAYLMLDLTHPIHDLIKQYGVPLVKRFSDMTFANAMSELDAMVDNEGFVLQFANGDMAKLKCPWYLRLHRNLSFLRERDIASAALDEALDDVKAALTELGVDLSEVLAVEARLKANLLALVAEIDTVFESGKHLDQKSFAIANKAHPLFALIMTRYLGKDVPLTDWYRRNRLRADFGLSVLASGARAEAIEG